MCFRAVMSAPTVSTQPFGRTVCSIQNQRPSRKSVSNDFRATLRRRGRVRAIRASTSSSSRTPTPEAPAYDTEKNKSLRATRSSIAKEEADRIAAEVAAADDAEEPVVHRADEALADSVFLDVTGRTAKRLLELSEGVDDFILPVTQEELAGMVGASRERVNKAIASFIRLGWIDQHERKYTILKRDSLDIRAR